MFDAQEQSKNKDYAVFQLLPCMNETDWVESNQGTGFQIENIIV